MERTAMKKEAYLILTDPKKQEGICHTVQGCVGKHQGQSGGGRSERNHGRQPLLWFP